MKEKYYLAGLSGLLLIKIVHRGTAHGWFGGIPATLVHFAFYLGLGLCVVQVFILLLALVRWLVGRINRSRNI